MILFRETNVLSFYFSFGTRYWSTKHNKDEMGVRFVLGDTLIFKSVGECHEMDQCPFVPFPEEVA